MPTGPRNELLLKVARGVTVSQVVKLLRAEWTPLPSEAEIDLIGQPDFQGVLISRCAATSDTRWGEIVNAAERVYAGWRGSLFLGLTYGDGVPVSARETDAPARIIVLLAAAIVRLSSADAPHAQTGAALAEALARLAGPAATTWTEEWPAHLAGLEPTWRRPFQVTYYLAGFARAALAAKLATCLRRPSSAIARSVDHALSSDAVCGTSAVAAVGMATWLTDQASGVGAASVVLISTTAAALTAVNQGRKMRGIKRKAPKHQ